MYNTTIAELISYLNEGQHQRFLKQLKDFLAEGVDDTGAENESRTLRSIIEDMETSIMLEKKRELAEEAANRGETTIPKDNWSVHETHCCKLHGCKYTDPDCPVTVGLIKQRYSCEDCEMIRARTEIEVHEMLETLSKRYDAASLNKYALNAIKKNLSKEDIDDMYPAERFKEENFTSLQGHNWLDGDMTNEKFLEILDANVSK